MNIRRNMPFSPPDMAEVAEALLSGELPRYCP